MSEKTRDQEIEEAVRALKAAFGGNPGGAALSHLAELAVALLRGETTGDCVIVYSDESHDTQEPCDPPISERGEGDGSGRAD